MMSKAPAKPRKQRPRPATQRPQPREATGQAERQGFDRQRLEPQDQPPADVLDDENIAGEKDFELKPPVGGSAS
jgi:hypothetical protein